MIPHRARQAGAGITSRNKQQCLLAHARAFRHDLTYIAQSRSRARALFRLDLEALALYRASIWRRCFIPYRPTGLLAVGLTVFVSESARSRLSHAKIAYSHAFWLKGLISPCGCILDYVRSRVVSLIIGSLSPARSSVSFDRCSLFLWCGRLSHSLTGVAGRLQPSARQGVGPGYVATELVGG